MPSDASHIITDFPPCLTVTTVHSGLKSSSGRHKTQWWPSLEYRQVMTHHYKNTFLHYPWSKRFLSIQMFPFQCPLGKPSQLSFLTDERFFAGNTAMIAHFVQPSCNVCMLCCVGWRLPNFFNQKLCWHSSVLSNNRLNMATVSRSSFSRSSHSFLVCTLLSGLHITMLTISH